MNRIDKSLNEFFEFSTIKGNFRWIFSLVVCFFVIWYMQDILSFFYALIGFAEYERSDHALRVARLMGGLLTGAGILISIANIFFLIRGTRTMKKKVSRER
jgi:hypothetical protein